MDNRLRLLVDAGMALTAELTLDGLLQRLTETAADLTGARYVALGVVAPDGSRLERFVTHGIDAATRDSMGELPQGHGILGALLKDAKPLRLADLSKDPRSVGFPPNHPPMKSFLGVPILLRTNPFGNLYLTEKAGEGSSRARTRSSSPCSLPRQRSRSRTLVSTALRRETSLRRRRNGSGWPGSCTTRRARP